MPIRAVPAAICRRGRTRRGHQHGYLVMIALALGASAFSKVMQPKLDAWDRTFATDADLAHMRDRGIPCANRAPNPIA